MNAPAGASPSSGTPGTTNAPQATGQARSRTAARTRQGAQAVVGLALAAALLYWGLPWVTHTTWPQITALVTGVGPGTFAVLLGLMMLGLFCYTFTLAGSMPGLGHVRALIANLAGSSVSNVLPGGGAFGAALTYAMFRSWRFSHRAISTSILVTTVWNLLARVLLPVVAAILLVPAQAALPAPIVQGALAGGAGGVLVAGVLIAVVASRRAAAALGRAGDVVLASLLRRRSSGAPPRRDVAAIALDLRATIIDIVRHRWVPLTFGLVGFMGVYFVLFALCARAVGADTPWPHLFAAYAVGRLLTAVAVTPGGIGVSEAGAAAVMVALGAPGDVAAATVTLFALFSFVLEIPFGAVAFVGWLATRRSYRPEAPAGEDERR